MRTEHRVRMFDTDCAGVIFFGSQFRFFHEAIEAFFDEIGYPFKSLFNPSAPFCFLVAHASGDFLKPLEIGDPLIIETSLKKLGTTSLILSFKLLRDEVLVGTGEIVQVCIDSTSRQKMAIPEDFKKKTLAFFN